MQRRLDEPGGRDLEAEEHKVLITSSPEDDVDHPVYVETGPDVD